MSTSSRRTAIAAAFGSPRGGARATLLGLLAVVVVISISAVAAGGAFASKRTTAAAPQLDLIHPGTLTIGTTNFPPFSFIPTGKTKVQGALIDVLQYVINKENLGLTIKQVVVPFASLIPAIQARKIDMVGDAMYRTSARAKQVLYLKYPTMYNPEALVVQKGDPKHLHSLKDLHNVTVGTYEGTVWVDWLKAIHKRDSSVKVKLYPSIQAVIADLATKRLDAAVIDASTTGYGLKQNPSLPLQIVPQYKPANKTSTGLYFSVKKGNTSLASVLNAGIHKLETTDRAKLVAILNRWGLKPTSFYLPPR
jgi:polar amino acid transport system substrate-binding protein